jgi:hypothetical protein
MKEAEPAAPDQVQEWREVGYDVVRRLGRIEESAHGIDFSFRLGKRPLWEDEPGWPEAEGRHAVPAEYAAGHGELLHEESLVVSGVFRVEELPGHYVLLGADGELAYPVLPVPELLAQFRREEFAP